MDKEMSFGGDVYAALAERLKTQHQDIQCQMIARIREIPDEVPTDAQYREGLRATVTALLDYAIKSIETAGARPIEIPSHAAEQARLAARAGIGIETVMRRYVVGSHALQGFVTEQAKPYPPHVLRNFVERLASNSSASCR